MKLVRSESAEQARQAAGERLNEVLSLSRSDKPLLLMLSGGSALRLLPLINTEFFDSSITVTVLDERFSSDNKINNFAQITQTTFYEASKARGANFIDTRVQEEETLEGLAARTQKALKDWRASYSGGHVVAILGTGKDGHVSGIMPYPEDPETFRKLFMGDRWVVGYDAGDKNPHPLRVTTTITYLRDLVDIGIVYAVGEEKRSVLEKVLSEQGSVPETPARVLREMKDVTIYTDIKI